MIAVMPWSHVVRAVATLALLLFLTALPFLPGRHDSAAAALFHMAQVLGILGLLLAAVGLVWLAFGRHRARTFETIAFIVGLLIWLLASVAHIATGSLSLLVVALTIGVCGAASAWRSITSARNGRLGHATSLVPALSLVLVPIIVVAAQFFMLDRLIESSRDRAMCNAEPLIAAIERYRVAHGRYPPSLHAEWPDVLPGVVGIPVYLYEPHGEAYNLIFEQLSHVLGTREFVVYNPRDEQQFWAHALDRLELPPERSSISMGHYAVHAASRPHWKSFLFD
jgi:hypothetical protein